MNATVRAAALYGVDRATEPMMKLIDVLVRCTGMLEATIPNLRKHRYKDLVESARAIRKLEKEGDAIFRGAVSALSRRRHRRKAAAFAKKRYSRVSRTRSTPPTTSPIR